jgi:CTP:molybdopterin cytidylyltransferase MocA
MAEHAVLVAVLAAGRASRFGGGKLDATLTGKPIGQWVLDAVAAAGLPAGVIVAGAEQPAFAAGSGWDLLHNARAHEGLGTSVALAARHASERDAPGLLVLLGDMPLVDPAHLRRLCESISPAATRYPSGRPGVPALFLPAEYDLLAGLSGDSGAAAVLAGRADVTLHDPPAGMLADVDTAADLASLAEALRREP